MVKSVASALGAVVLAAAVALSFASPAEAGQTSTLLKAKVSRHSDGPFKTQIDVNVLPQTKRNTYLKVKNLTGATQEANLRETKDLESPFAYVTKFLRDGVDVTSHVRGSGYVFTVPPEGSRLFRMKTVRDPSYLGTNELRLVVKDVALRNTIARVWMDRNLP